LSAGESRVVLIRCIRQKAVFKVKLIIMLVYRVTYETISITTAKTEIDVLSPGADGITSGPTELPVGTHSACVVNVEDEQVRNIL